MYKVGELGDCFLLTFGKAKKLSHVVIDCGSFRNSSKSKTRLRKIANHIKETIGQNPVDLLVGTHQHNDHMSGFAHAEDIFRDITVNQVFLSWLDNPKDKLRGKVLEEHKKIVSALRDIQKANKGVNMDKTLKDALNSLIDFGAKGDGPVLTNKATELLKELGQNDIEYVSPGMSYSLPGDLSELVKVHVLGPPRSYVSLKDTSAGKKETYDPHLSFLGVKADALNRVAKVEENYPFNKKYTRKISDFNSVDFEGYQEYQNPKFKWRNIDNDWKSMATGMALHLDSMTNNTSIVLAFELVDSNRYLLFVGDAQTGNWNSWTNIKWEDEKVSTDDILENTVFYKVGHHGSHNATQPQVFEKANHPDLIAMIPVDKSDPNLTKSYHPWKMPAKNLNKRLHDKTEGRVLRMDDTKLDRKVNWTKKPKIDKNLFVEVEII